MNKIALIDDHKIFCDSLAGLINDFEGFNVIWCAQDGKQAIRLFANDNNLPEIILLDIVMPGMSGVEVAKWLFESDLFSRSPFLTAFTYKSINNIIR